jgi:rubrerythrin
VYWQLFVELNPVTPVEPGCAWAKVEQCSSARRWKTEEYLKEATPDFGTVDRILEAALAKEKEAHQFYSDMLTHPCVEPVRDMIEKLLNEEDRHVRMIEKMLEDLNLGHGLG